MGDDVAGGTSVHMSTPLRFGVRATLNAPEMTHSCRRNGKGNVGRHSRSDSILPYGVALRLLRVVQRDLAKNVTHISEALNKHLGCERIPVPNRFT